MKRGWSLTSIGGTLTMLVGLTAVAAGLAPTFYGCLGARGTLTRVSEGTPTSAPTAPTVSTLVSRNETGPQEARRSQRQRGLQGPTRLRGAQGLQRPQGLQGPQPPRGITGPECHAAFCG